MELDQIRRIEEREWEKYTKLHSHNYGSTGYQTQLSEYVHKTARKGDKILDLGCGTGVAVKRLLLKGRNVKGVYITLAGVGTEFLPNDRGSRTVLVDLDRFVQAPLWRLPFRNGEFDYSYSSDVLEHIPPELIENVLKEIFRVTDRRTLHVVSTAQSRYADKLHLTVRTMRWWKGMLMIHNVRGIQADIMDCDEFLAKGRRK